MKKIFTLLFAIWLADLSAQDVYFTSQPYPSPDGTTTYFVYHGDIWKVPTAGGMATQVTSLEGDESRPLVSPDGKWLAFSSTQFGNADIYLMSLTGGEIQQLTYHDGFDFAESWAWDSETIYFTSNRYNRMSAYTVSISGGTPQRLFGHYFNNVHNVVESPDGDIYFNETWESFNFAHRKRYRGKYNPDIKRYTASGNYEKLTTFEGKDMWPTIARNGELYFVSDEETDEYNLFKLENGSKSRHTDFETSIKRPRISADGSVVVFEKDYQLFSYQADGEAVRIPIQLPRNYTLEQLQDFNVAGNISDFDVSPDGKKLAFISRGELFVSDVKGRFIRQLPGKERERVVEVHWIDDNQLLVSQTVKGYLNWFRMEASGEGAMIQLTSDTQNNRNLTFDSGRKKAVYLSGRNQIRIMDLSSYVSTTIVEDELWAIYNPPPHYSPDDRYILYNAKRDFENDVFVYDTQTSEVTNLTGTGVGESAPFWGPDGKYIYFSSDRVTPGYPRGGGSQNIYRIALDKFSRPFRSDKVDELFEKEEPAPAAANKKKQKKKGDDVEPAGDDPEVVINLDGINERWETIGPRFGNQSTPVAFREKDKVIVYYSSNHEGGRTVLASTTFEDFEDPEDKTTKVRGSALNIRSSDDAHFILTGGNVHTFNIASGEAKKVEMKYTFRRNLNQEFHQMFYEAWANFEENFYDENFHGVDWEAKRAQYAAYLPNITSRGDLRVLFNDMLGELNTSHFGFYSNGDEEEVFYGSRTSATGILFNEQQPYIVSRVVARSAADKKGVDVQPGDRLVEVNGVAIDAGRNREWYFTRPSLDEEMTLTFDRNGAKVETKVHPESTGSLRGNLYDEWISDNQGKVDSETDSRVAYIHMKNMGGGALNQFYYEMVSEAYQREALILDIRYNTGGNVHDDVLKFLSAREYLRWKYREGKLTSQSNFAPADKPIILLINEQTLSDGEMTTEGFKQLKLGTVVGTETYRWIIFTTGNGLVDGSFYRLPSWGCYTLTGEDLELTGVSPDIEVANTFADRVQGNDPQLAKAIELALEQLK